MSNTLPFIMYLFLTMIVVGCHSAPTNKKWGWEKIDAIGEPVARHEAGLVGLKDNIYLIGGRGVNNTSIFNTNTNEWINASPPPLELHHFQPIVYKDKVYIVGALTGQWPFEKPVEKVIIYTPETDTYEYGHDIPKHRLRGAAGTAMVNGKIYLVGGIKNGHMNGYVSWFDEYDPETGLWQTLPDAPIARDHFQMVYMDNKLYAFAGRKTSKATNQDMALTIEHGNIFNFKTKSWEQTTSDHKIPTARAGNSAFAWQNQIIIGGGESVTQIEAHNEVEAFNTNTLQWSNWPRLSQGRHGTGFVVIDDYVYTASGSGNKGGEPELLSIERLKLPSSPSMASVSTQERPLPIIKQWHTFTANFKGPLVSETTKHNPFLNYKLLVEFLHIESQSKITLPGYFAADGDSANTGADTGDIWQVKFNPNLLGEWQYTATLYAGKNIAISKNYDAAKKISIQDSQGVFRVIPTDKHGNNFKAHGRLSVKNGQFIVENNNKHWLKAGTNSPENLLGYKDFDGTYRITAQARDGEAAPNAELHQYEAHINDWKSGDPSWQKGKGKSIIGSMNYLASQGMNSSYFLTMNILGDGKDVWPYVNHHELDRFDVSKLAQWEIVFEHMQEKGILLHMVIQETENETMLDNGDTGPQRQLYFNELIARFGHHLGLIWNLGEENGYAKWSPNAQNTQQRMAMATYLKANDPLQHPVLLHTHSHDPDRENILTPLLGFKDIDGLSLQVDKRIEVSSVIKRWKNSSRANGHQWLITMDEIGMWHTAALPDSIDKDHHSLRRHVLWGALLSGGAGVEWYFGAKYPHNDLTSEDWRQRESLWKLTKHAKSFLESHIPYWQLEPCKELSTQKKWLFCSQTNNDTFVYYFSDAVTFETGLKLVKDNVQTYDIKWFNPIDGGELQTGSKSHTTIETLDLGRPPNDKAIDWVVLLQKRAAS